MGRVPNAYADCSPILLLESLIDNTMKVDLTKAQLIDLIHTIKPKYFKEIHPAIGNNGKFLYLDYEVLVKMKEEEIFDLYKRLY